MLWRKFFDIKVCAMQGAAMVAMEWPTACKDWEDGNVGF